MLWLGFDSQITPSLVVRDPISHNVPLDVSTVPFKSHRNPSNGLSRQTDRPHHAKVTCMTRKGGSQNVYKKFTVFLLLLLYTISTCYWNFSDHVYYCSIYGPKSVYSCFV